LLVQIFFGNFALNSSEKVIILEISPKLVAFLKIP